MNWDIIGVAAGLISAMVAQYVQLTNRITRQQVRLDHTDKNHDRLEQSIKDHNDKLERAMGEHGRKFDEVVAGINEIKRLLAKSGIE
jgi:cell division protein FtsB